MHIDAVGGRLRVRQEELRAQVFRCVSAYLSCLLVVRVLWKCMDGRRSFGACLLVVLGVRVLWK